MAYRLPPLNTLRLFEAAGRHCSFKLAAEELNVTPSAVSHGIQTLEDWLGVPLFVRGHRSLELTSAGRAYLPRVRDALAQLASATEAVPGRRPTGKLSVSVAPTFGLRWLVPNLHRFHERHPDIEVTLDTSLRPVEFPRDGIDIAIRMGRGDWPDLYALCLVVEELVPVCSPDMAASIVSVADLRSRTLLHVVNVSEDWAVWADLADVSDLDLGRGLRMDTLHMALEAAAPRAWASPSAACPWPMPTLPPAGSFPCSGRPAFARPGIGWSPTGIPWPVRKWWPSATGSGRS